jgi:histone acetyltransferase (RNA polymerase elongator complex component)
MTVAPSPESLTEEYLRKTIFAHLDSAKRKPDRVQIAFYGGNFTGIEEEEQTRLLKAVQPFIEEGLVQEIRISTRPDYIDNNVVDRLDKYHVRAVEIGVQSLSDHVLAASGRGHNAAAVIKAMDILKTRGLETGIHLMVGLPGDDENIFRESVEKTIALAPDTVRIHPTIVFRDTALAELYSRGEYRPLSREEAIDACKFALRKFAQAKIHLIRVGLQSTAEMEKPGNIIAGPFHPAFRTLVEESLFLDMASSLLAGLKTENGTISFSLAAKDISSFRGLKNVNISALKRRFSIAEIKVAAAPEQARGSLFMTAGDRHFKLYDYTLYQKENIH